MKVTHVTTLTTQLNPFSRTSKVPRLILALLPPNAHKSIKIKTTQLPRNSKLPALLELGFKDGKTMKWEWSESEEKSAGVVDIVTEANRHTRMLSRKEELTG